MIADIDGERVIALPGYKRDALTTQFESTTREMLADMIPGPAVYHENIVDARVPGTILKAMVDQHHEDMATVPEDQDAANYDEPRYIM